MILGGDALAAFPLAGISFSVSSIPQLTFVRYGVLPIDKDVSMSNLITWQPLPFQLGIMSTNDNDGLWLINCSDWANARNITIASVGTPIVQRKDNVAIGPNDLVVSNVGVVKQTTVLNGFIVDAGYGFFFDAFTNGNATIYYIGFPIQDSVGNKVIRWAALPVISFPG